MSTGLYIKYDVKHIRTGEPIKDCFVLRPDRDPAAIIALKAYAHNTINKQLKDDILAWVEAIEKGILTSPLNLNKLNLKYKGAK